MDDNEDMIREAQTRQAKAALVIVLMTIIIIGAVCSCTPKIVEVIHTKIEYRDRIIHDTLSYQIPVEVEKIVTRDTASHLENTFAQSDAVVSDGFLSHSLESKPQIIKVPYEVVVHDTLYIEKQSQIQTITEYKDKPLSLWRTFEIKSFWWLVGIALFGWRRELLKLVKLISKWLI